MCALGFKKMCTAFVLIGSYFSTNWISDTGISHKDQWVTVHERLNNELDYTIDGKKGTTLKSRHIFQYLTMCSAFLTPKHWKRAEARSEVRERASACPVWSSSQTASSILPHRPTNPWRPSNHVQDYPWSHGIPHGVRLRTSNPHRATRPHLQVPPTAMLYAPSPIRLHASGCPILEQTTGWYSQRILGEILQDTPRCSLAVLVPRSTHLTHFLSQPIPSTHIDPR